MKYEEIGYYKVGCPKVAIVIPYRPGSKELATKAARVCFIRAGMPCKVFTIEDSERKGWVNAQNWAFNNLDFDFYIYSCDDYFPCKDYLKSAYEAYLGTKKCVIVFNDGKWAGKLATIALVKKDFVKEKLPDGNLFYKGYKQNFADPEFTDHAINHNEMAYLSDIPFMEVEYGKDEKSHNNEEDRELYKSRGHLFLQRFL